MRHFVTSLVLATIGASAIANAQGWYQPWTPPRTSFESRVRSAANPTPLSRIAYDDFQVATTTTFRQRITWWGWMSSSAQIWGKYYVAIYKTVPGGCRPDLRVRVWSGLLDAEEVLVGPDCQGRSIYRMFAPFPTPFVAIAGQKYWIEIAEDDSRSARVGVEDFRWSGRRPRIGCPAVQLLSGGLFLSPLKDACDNQPDDLSFELWP